MGVYFGVDVGGTNTKFGLFNSTGELVKKWETKTRLGGDNGALFLAIARMIQAEAQNNNIPLSQILGVGIGVPGPVKDDGYVGACVNLKLGNLNVSQVLSEALGGILVATTNDANAAALGEMWRGSGKGHENLVMVTLGTGVGSGVVVHGSIVNGKRGVAGEIGHIIVNPDETEFCNCGGKGCLDQTASATGVVRNTKRLLAKDPQGKNSVLFHKPKFSAKDVVDAAKAGDEMALRGLKYCMEFLGKTLADIGQIMDPDAFVIGGGLSNAGDFLLDIIRYYYEKHSIFAKEKVDLILAQLGNDAGIYGAAKMILDAVAQT